MQYDIVTHADLKHVAYLQPDGWTDISEEFRDYIDNRFAYPVKLTLDHEIIGVGSSMVFKHTAWIAHIIVRNDYRNRGIGTQIVDYLLSDLKQKSVQSVLLISTELGKSLYVKAGFRHVSDYVYMKRQYPWRESPCTTHVVPYTGSYYSQVMSFDRNISGEDREALISIYLTNAWLYLDREKLRGCYLPDLGEGMILADDPEAGTELMKIKYAKEDKAVIPSGNIAAIEFLKQNGFMETEQKGTRMVLGKEVFWKPEGFFSRIGGNYG
ncbi:MAG: GNAT family N-acetyltransferase [Bacteroidota bacterium]